MTELERTQPRVVQRTDPPATAKTAEPELDSALQAHYLTVLSVSSGMVGVCLTAIGLIGIVRSLNKIETVVDDMLALGTLVFTLAAALSFVGMRTRIGRRWRHLARTLDLIFLLGLALIVAAVMLLTWVVI